MKKPVKFTLFAALLLTAVTAAGTVVARAQDKTVLLICTWDTSSIFKGKDGRDKFERRFYVSPTISLSFADFQTIDRQGNRIEGACGDYIDKTVMKAATERGEKLDPSGSLTVIRNVELSGENIGSGKNMYNFASKEDVEKKRDASVKEMLGADRFIMKFNWDVTGKAEADDLVGERKRTIPTIKPPAKP